MKKSEMQAASTAYQSCLSLARMSLQHGRIQEGIEAAVGALEHVDGMMRYQSRYEDATFETLECVEIVLQHAPLALDSESLERLGELLKRRRRVEKETDRDLSAALESARMKLDQVHHVLDGLEFATAAECDHAVWSELVSDLLQAGLVERDGRDGYSLVTRLGETWRARCHLCGVSVSGPKREFLVRAPCPGCHDETEFALIARVAAGGGAAC